VPTVDTVRYSYLVSCLVSSNFPVMLVGPVGTGKTSVAQGVLSKLDPVAYSVLTVNLSAQVCTGRCVPGLLLEWLGSLVVGALDLPLGGREFHSRPPQLLGWVIVV